MRIAPCSHFLFCRSEATGEDVLSSSSFGKSIGLTSATPGAMYTTPRLEALG